MAVKQVCFNSCSWGWTFCFLSGSQSLLDLIEVVLVQYCLRFPNGRSGPLNNNFNWQVLIHLLLDLKVLLLNAAAESGNG